MTSAAERRLAIHTPEGVQFSLVLAGPLTRSLAWAVDACVISAASGLVGKLLSAAGSISQDVAIASGVLSWFVISVGYGIACEWLLRGQTVGKRVLRLRVMDARGLKLRFSQVAIRNLLRFIDSLPVFYLVGGVACALTRHVQRLGDIAANTVVVRHRQVSLPDASSLLGERYNSLLHWPQLTARLRHKVSPEAIEIALEALLRRDTLDPSSRIELFNALAAHFAALVPFPEEDTIPIASEQYVRNVIEAVLRPKRQSETVSSQTSLSY